jgi:hypothetical protein
MHVLCLSARYCSTSPVSVRIFYTAIRLPDTALHGDSERNGFHVSDDTLRWWSQQSSEAQQVLSDPDARPLPEALQSFMIWLTNNTLPDYARMWGNGAAFDNVILSSAYRITGLHQPWKHWNDRCYRTVKNQYPDIKLERVGTHHNALDDARTQAQHLLATGAPLN